MMVKINSYDEYADLVNTILTQDNSYTTNCYLLRNNIVRLIELNRLFYERFDGGIIIYDDEIEYYQCLIYCDDQHDIVIGPKEKKLVFMFISLDGYHMPEVELIKEKLLANSFSMTARLRQVSGDSKQINNNLNDVYTKSKEIFDERGYRIDYPSYENIEGIKEVLLSLETLPIYQLPNITDEELIEEGKQGKHICVIDCNGKVVAVAGDNSDKGSTAYIGILREHRMMSGIATVLSKAVLEYKMKNALKSVEWIDETNVASLNYHSSIGYKCGNRVLEYYVRDDI